MTCIIGSSDFSPLKKKKKDSVGGFKGYNLHDFFPLSVTFWLLFPPVLKGQRPSKLNEIMSRATGAVTSSLFSLFIETLSASATYVHGANLILDRF